jgi:hypothetical protein
VKIASSEKTKEFSGDNLGSRVTLFNEKLISKIKEDRWDEVLLQCTSQDMDDILSGDEAGDALMLDNVAGDVLTWRAQGNISNGRHLTFTPFQS